MHKQGLLVYAALAMSALGAFGCSAKDHDKAAVDDGSAPPGPFSTTKYNLQFEGRYFCEETGAAWPEPGACWGTFDADIYHPTDASGAPYPAVVAASGHLGNKDAINWVAEYLATYGYIVMVFSQPHPDQWNATQLAAGHRTGIDVLTEENMRSGSPISGQLKASFGVLGHSEGGGGAIEASGTDSRVKATVGLATWIGWAEDQVRDRATLIASPTLLLAGSADPINAAGSQEIYGLITRSPSKYYVELNQVDHFDFVTGLGPEQYKNWSKKYFRLLFGFALKGSTEDGQAIAKELTDDTAAGTVTVSKHAE